MTDYPHQGEISKTFFNEGWERPAVVVSRNELNRGRLVLVVPFRLFCLSKELFEIFQHQSNVLEQIYAFGSA